MRGKSTFKCSQRPMVLLDLTFAVEVNMAWVSMYLGKKEQLSVDGISIKGLTIYMYFIWCTLFCKQTTNRLCVTLSLVCNLLH